MQNKKKFLGTLICAIMLVALLVVPMLALNASAADAGEWKLVTDASTLKAGDKIVIASNSKGAVAGNLYSTSKYLTKVDASFSSDKSTISSLPSSAMQFTLGGSADAWTLTGTDGKTVSWSGNDLSSTASNKWTISISNGTASIATTTNASNKLQYNSSSPRFKTYTSSQTAIQIYRLELDVCAHNNTNTVTVDATCEEAGYTTVTCSDCGKEISKVEIPELGHSYSGGVCSRCGEEESFDPQWVLTDISEISSTDIVVIVATNSSNKSFAMSNNNGTGSAPAAVSVTVDGNVLSSDIADNIKWNISYDGANIIIYPNGTTSTWLYTTTSNNGVRVGTNANKTFTIDSASGYIKNTATSRYLGVYNSQDWRCYTNTTGNTANQTFAFYVYTEPSSGGDTSCGHTNTTTKTVDATCTDAGSITEICDECGEIISEEVISAIGHDYEITSTTAATCETPGSKTETCRVCGDVVTSSIPTLSHDYIGGICQDCGAVEPPRYYIATKRTEGNYFWMTSDLGTASTKRYQAVDSGSSKLPWAVTNPEAGYVFVLVDNGDETYSIYAEGVDGDNYLGWSSGNSGILVPADDAIKFALDENDDGTVSIHFAADEERYLALNSNSSYGYFAWYKSGQAQNLVLVPVITSPALIGAQVNVAADLAIKYHTYIPEGYDVNDFTLRITTAHGRELEISTYTTDNGNYVFTYAGIAPQCMSDNIKAELLYNGEVVDTVADYSIVQNAKNLAARADATDALKVFLADLLAYGQAAQEYINHDDTISVITDDDITAIGAPESEKAALDESILETDRIFGKPTNVDSAYISGAGVRFDTQLQLYVTVKGNDVSAAKVMIGEVEYDIEILGGKNVAYLPGMLITELSKPVTIDLYVGDECVHTVTYGAYAYVYQMITGKPDTTMAKLALALYNCAESAKTYKNA